MAALNVGPGDEVIVPDFTFIATASAVLFARALPVMVDVLPDTHCIDSDLVEAGITPRTKAIIAVHMGGHPADLDRLSKIARDRGIALVEDSSHAHASEWRGERIGTFGSAATFSFQSSKLITADEGGIILTNDDSIERLARSVHDCGRMPGEWFYSHFIYGSNYRLSEWQGAVLSAQLTRLDEQTAHRHKNARLLDRLLGAIAGITPQKLASQCTRNGQYAYIFHVDRSAFGGISTEKFIAAMNAEGIPNQASYPPLHALDVFKSGAPATAPTMRAARSGSSSSVAPAPVFVTFFTGHPKLMSTRSAPAASTIRAASAITAGSEPKIWIASGCSSVATRRYPSVRSFRCSIPAQLTISEQTRPAP